MRIQLLASTVGAVVAVAGGIRLYELTLPVPVLNVRHIEYLNNSASVDVYVTSASYGPLHNLEYKHNNLPCLYSKGYEMRSFTTGYSGDKEPMLSLYNSSGKHKTRAEFMALCTECNVSTDLKCEGVKEHNVRWDMYA